MTSNSPRPVYWMLNNNYKGYYQDWAEHLQRQTQTYKKFLMENELLKKFRRDTSHRDVFGPPNPIHMFWESQVELKARLMPYLWGSQTEEDIRSGTTHLIKLIEEQANDARKPNTSMETRAMGTTGTNHV
jgi:hypothetical protein